MVKMPLKKEVRITNTDTKEVKIADSIRQAATSTDTPYSILHPRLEINGKLYYNNYLFELIK